MKRGSVWRGAVISGFLVLATGLAPRPASAGDPTYVEGVNTFIETGIEAPDRAPSWYAPMAGKPYAPVFEMLATRGTQGRYYSYTYPVTLKDMIRFHGHDCEGTIHAAANVRVAFDLLFPDGIIDRSVLRGISGPSPCWSDAVAFLTGARIQYGNLGYFKDARYGHAILLYREDTQVAVLATWKKGINNIPGEPVMLPDAIDWQPAVDQNVVMKLKSDVKAQGGTPTPYQVDLLRYLQWKHVNDILEHPLDRSYQVQVLENFRWEDWIDPARAIAAPLARTDTRLKNYPYRPRPISGPDAPGQ
ncbi:formylmethanofuran dehydrogenase subunit E family protein [Acidimangrovimonas sediminis]|uniref:formylmethanofuran dehydrogenase subunit E family protein n=1 Tax=Acidimangrovimonas sediminis TaxID=2056283 RepID=UPI000C80D7D6|nr:formylmethanofuran dehydrogenase subunit E family protein [Acidimangrovimonas sediminis]